MNSTEKGNLGEQLVFDVLKSKFFDVFCFLNPIDIYGDKKEICDIIILINDIVILISVKNYEFKGLYDRYFNSTISKAINQLYGAERKLYGNREICFEHPTLGIVNFDAKKIKNVYSIIVNLGEGLKFYPFSKSTKSGRFISIFDKFTFENIINELDTIPDFVKYLKDREIVFSNFNTTILPLDEYDFDENDQIQFFERMSGLTQEVPKDIPINISGSELDLLALYLKDNRTFPKHLTQKEFDFFYVIYDGEWAKYVENLQVIGKKILDKRSYFIDDLIKRELLPKVGLDSLDTVTYFSLLTRFERRYISNAFLSMAFSPENKKLKKQELYLMRRSVCFDKKGFVFAIYTDDWDKEKLVFTLQIALEAFCVFSEFQAKDYVLIGTTFDFNGFYVGFMPNVTPFSEEYIKDIKYYADAFGFYSDYSYQNIHESEYPDLDEA